MTATYGSPEQSCMYTILETEKGTIQEKERIL